MWRLSFGLALLASAAGCDITRVTAPATTQLQNFQNPAGAMALRGGFMSEVTLGFSVQVLYSGLLVDEFMDTPSLVDGSTEDRRVIDPTNSDYPYETLSEARIDGINAIAALKRYDPSPSWPIAELYALVAATEISFSENLCSGLPLAQVGANGIPSYGPALSRNGLLAQALADLDSASNYVASTDSIASFVAVLRGRALLDSGQIAAAGAAVAGVAQSFVYPLVYNPSASNQTSWLTQYMVQQQNYSVSDREGVNGMPFVSGHDQRVPTTAVTGPVATVYAPNSALSTTSQIVLSSGVEGRLIAAEAALASGSIGAWAATLNTLRASGISPSMAPLPADSTTAATASLRTAVMFRERAFWLFATGHRQGDLRRLVRQYGVPVNSAFPTGPYQGGPATYGTAVVFTPFGETSDPTYKGCFDLNP